jgi:hypothetical protein
VKLATRLSLMPSLTTSVAVPLLPQYAFMAWTGTTSPLRTRLKTGRFSKTSRPALGPTQPPTQCVAVFLPAVKRPGRGVNHPSPITAEVAMGLELQLYLSSVPA